jgi:ubiquinone/menaquinone biosynthesis C-methylase UbiE
MNIAIGGGRFVMPEVVTTQFMLKEGDVVADYGAGSGFYLKPVSTAVGENGLVYACEIQKQLVEKLGDIARQQGLGNVHPLWCDLEEPNGIKIADGELDAAILINTLFMIENKEVGIVEMARPLRSGGTFLVVDWTESFAGMGPSLDHVITAAQTTDLFEANGFVLEREFPTGDHHYGLAFRKA